MVVTDSEMTVKGKNVLVVGLARSGTAAANLLSSLGASVTVTDKKSRSSLGRYINELSTGVTLITDAHPESIFLSSDIIVVSPGVPSGIEPLQRAQMSGVPVIGELELAYEVIHSGFRGGSEFIGITGTNGKSTTTTLVDLMIRKSGRASLLGGNIGNALTEEIWKMIIRERGSLESNEKVFTDLESIPFPEWIVAEISSFQLETINEFRPKIAVILNITPDHLDRYGNIYGYSEAKSRIFENQGDGDYVIINADDPVIMNMIPPRIKPGKEGGPQLLFFSREKEVNGIYLNDASLFVKLPLSVQVKNEGVRPGDNHFLIKTENIRLHGMHNIENAMAASLSALLAGCSFQSVQDALRDFKGLEHRLEYVDEISGIRFINDSKGTNVGAVAKSLEGLDSVFLIMGGQDKGGDFSVLRDIIAKKVKLMILIGEARDKIKGVLGDVTETVMADDLSEAIRISLLRGLSGDVVLLSPGCASFDMFENFEDRGRQFKDAVRREKERIG